MGTDLNPDQYFALCVQEILEAEGRMSNDPVNDPNGGLTKFGISQKQNPDVDVASLTKDQAIALYKIRYWFKNRCQDMPWPVNFMVFDADVNQGTFRGAVLLQLALQVPVDGRIDEGGATLRALAKADPWEVAARLGAKRAVVYSKSALWASDGEGWMYRLMKLAFYAGKSSQPQQRSQP